MKADTITEFIAPVSQLLNIPVIPTRTDTLRDPDDFYNILAVDTINSISVRFANVHRLSFTMFYKTIKELELKAFQQSIEVDKIETTFYSEQTAPLHFEHITEESFEKVRYAIVNFFFKKDENKFTYPIVFVK